MIRPIGGVSAADVIIADLTSRGGLRQAWEEIDEEIQKEIRDEWDIIIQSHGGR